MAKSWRCKRKRVWVRASDDGAARPTHQGHEHKDEHCKDNVAKEDEARVDAWRVDGCNHALDHALQTRVREQPERETVPRTVGPVAADDILFFKKRKKHPRSKQVTGSIGGNLLETNTAHVDRFGVEKIASAIFTTVHPI